MPYLVRLVLAPLLLMAPTGCRTHDDPGVPPTSSSPEFAAFDGATLPQASTIATASELIDSGRFEDARDVLKTLTQENPLDVTPALLLSIVYDALGERAAADAEWLRITGRSLRPVIVSPTRPRGIIAIDPKRDE
ncbi:MAG: hypothetical protein HMLKMBBP_01118 [Planctomycetes bacterium]|nr:hypothetical protein [Planctomycetota bacterium]